LAQRNNCYSIAYHLQRARGFFRVRHGYRRGRPLFRREERGQSGEGTFKRKPLKTVVRRVDAIKVDLKAFSEKFYKEVVKRRAQARAQHAGLDSQQGTWNEIVYLVIPP